MHNCRLRKCPFTENIFLIYQSPPSPPHTYTYIQTKSSSNDTAMELQLLAGIAAALYAEASQHKTKGTFLLKSRWSITYP